mmetsp:Transcript_13032/g.20121  ORF Transcript_13032/g.20121 Transcript_13032/m.20121 type:complete len:93 (+) Transcript_13032:871-1149(+)
MAKIQDFGLEITAQRFVTVQSVSCVTRTSLETFLQVSERTQWQTFTVTKILTFTGPGIENNEQVRKRWDQVVLITLGFFVFLAWLLSDVNEG